MTRQELNVRPGQHAAHETVSADQTTWDYGRRGMRLIARSVNICPRSN